MSGHRIGTSAASISLHAASTIVPQFAPIHPKGHLLPENDCSAFGA